MKKKIVGICAACLALLTLFTGCKSSTAYNREKREKMQRYERENASLEKGQIVMVGDSIVELLQNYPEMLEGLEYKVYNRGISGDTSDRMLERLDCNVLNLEPKAVSILVGTNDYGRIEEDKTVENIETAVKRCLESGATVFLQSIYPVKKEVNPNMVGGRENATILRLNERLKERAEALGAIYLDLHPLLADEKGEFDAALTYDGLHPNEAGYRVITEFLRGQFEALGNVDAD